MSAKIVYEKTYPQIKIPDPPAQEINFPPYHKFCDQIEEETRYYRICTRQNQADRFIRFSIELSMLYEIDIVITQHEGRVTVEYAIDACSGLQQLNQVFAMADEISFFPHARGRDLVISLDYYTHIEVRNGRVIAPNPPIF